MQTSTEMTWILIAFVMFVGFATNTLMSDLPLVWGSAMFVSIPFELLMNLAGAFPLFAPLFVLALLYYFNVLVPSAVGEGFTWFIVAAIIITMVGL
ncbi:hypothetical protein HYV43_04470 [Candidatus Micrarchaeota archaeon]|nr:hypothetical protein [Candidatus Micrarchaeota archaeon]